jgi:hypothetical protein
MLLDWFQQSFHPMKYTWLLYNMCTVWGNCSVTGSLHCPTVKPNNTMAKNYRLTILNIPYNLESNPHPFYSFRGLKSQMRIIIACGLDSQSRAGFCKNDRAAVRATRTQYNNLLFYLLLIIIIYYSSDSLSSLITESLSMLPTQSLSSLSSNLSSHSMSFLDPSSALLMQHFYWHIVVLCHNASPNRHINLMAQPLLALKWLRGIFKDLAFFIASSQSRS